MSPSVHTRHEGQPNIPHHGAIVAVSPLFCFPCQLCRKLVKQKWQNLAKCFKIKCRKTKKELPHMLQTCCIILLYLTIVIFRRFSPRSFIQGLCVIIGMYELLLYNVEFCNCAMCEDFFFLPQLGKKYLHWQIRSLCIVGSLVIIFTILYQTARNTWKWASH